MTPVPASPPAAAAPCTALSAPLERWRWDLTRHLGDTGLGLFQLGDSLQRDAIDWLVPGTPSEAAAWLGSAGRTARFLGPCGGRPGAWRELANKVDVYFLVRAVANRIGVPPAGRPFDLDTLVARAYALDDFSALWAVEGLGHAYALRLWPGAGDEGLLNGPRAARLPAKSLTMLHAGIGLAFAQRLLGELPPGSPGRTRATVAEVLRLARASSRPGYEGAALESLGLVTRTFHGERIGDVDHALRDLGEGAARAFFWHGVGRALYFLPVNALPFGDTSWRPFEMGVAEAPDGEVRHDVLAGLAWAFVLVNMRQPELVGDLLLASHGARLEREIGFANGVASSIVMRTDTTPGSPLVERFLTYRQEAAAAGAWERLVARPSRDALRRVYPEMVRRGELGEIFRWRADLGRGVAA